MKCRNKFLIFFLIFFMIPSSVFAYSDYIIAGGDNIGIEIHSKRVIVVGTYSIGGNNSTNIQQGDVIIKINDQDVYTIDDMLSIIDNSSNKESINVDFLRGSKKMNTKLNLVYDDGVYKTGLYVKDTINGIGTLTFIDPNTKLYGALGHEIIEKSTTKKLEIKDGKIYNSTVTGINPSDSNNPGEKNAIYDVNTVYGDIKENTSSGIFGSYSGDILNRKLYKVASYDDIKLGKAKILTVINDSDIEAFDINVIRVSDNYDSVKNILFEVSDKKLLSIAGGIVQGMSGSPIIQDDMIVGAVTHVVVDDPTKGYGILITTMLEEAENWYFNVKDKKALGMCKCKKVKKYVLANTPACDKFEKAYSRGWYEREKYLITLRSL